MTIRIQVIKVYDIEEPDDLPNAIAHAYGLQTTEIEEQGKLISAHSDHAEVVGEEQIRATSV